MTNADALKNLFIALGGSSADVADMSVVADIIAAIAQLITQGGGGGSDNAFIIHALQDGQTATLDKTYAEIVAAIEAEKRVVCMFQTSNYGVSVLTNVAYKSTWTNKPVYMTNVSGNALDYIQVYENGTVTCTTGVSFPLN